MKMRFVRGRSEGRTVDLHAGMKIGRADDNDLVLDEDGVSRHHCRINGSGDALKIEDLESTNGTRVNGERITAARDIVAGDRLGVGDAVMLVTDDAGNVPATAAMGGDGKPNLLVGALFGTLLTLLVLGGIAGGVYYGTDWARRPMVQRERSEDVSTPMVDDGEDDMAGQVDVGGRAEGGDELDMDSFIDVEAEADVDVAVESGEDELDLGEAAVEAVVGMTPESAVSPNRFVVRSTPSNALVLVDDVEKGLTPVVVEGLSEGRHRISVKKDGYEEASRLVYAPVLKPLSVFELHLSPGVVQVTSTPVGATVVHGGRVLGNTPLLTSALPSGAVALRLLSYGYEPLSVQIDVSPHRGQSVHCDLSSAMGHLRVVTIPGGCDVFVNGVLMGRTATTAGKSENRSDPLIIPQMRAGVHAVKVSHPNNPSAHEVEVTVRPGEGSMIPVRLFALTERIVLNDGTEFVGMPLAVNEIGDVTFLTPTGRQVLLRERIVSTVPLSVEDAREILDEQAAEAAERAAAAEAAAPPSSDESGGFWETDETPVDESGWGEESEEPLEPEVMELSVENVEALLDRETATNLSRIFTGRLVRVTGTPTSSRKNMLEGHVQFGRAIRCIMPRDEYDRVQEQIKSAEDGGSLTITGIGKPMGNILTLEKCIVD